MTAHILDAPCICWQQELRLFGKQTNRQAVPRQGKEGNCKLYHMIEETITECERRET